MPLPEELRDWNSDDQSILRQFLESRTGGKLVAALAESAPVLLDGVEVNRTLVRNGELRGYQAAMRELLALAHPNPVMKPEVPEYPPLERDEFWNDGKKIEPPTQ